MNKINEKFISLFDEWSSLSHHKGKGFIRDGIIDYNKWTKSNRKVLFILKEAYSNSSTPEDFDLCELIRDEWCGAKYNVWWNVAYWAYGIHHSDSNHIVQKPDNKDEYILATESLLSSAIINIKKSSGRSTSDKDELKLYANRDLSFIKREFELINPDIVICGFVWDYIKDIWTEVKPIYDLVYKYSDIYFVDFWHPANQFPKKLNYYCLLSIIANSGFFKYKMLR